jgi:hypothetical protein
VDPQLDERALVDQQGQTLAGGQLVALVLGRDLLRTTAKLDLLSARAQILRERPEEAG